MKDDFFLFFSSLRVESILLDINHLGHLLKLVQDRACLSTSEPISCRKVLPFPQTWNATIRYIIYHQVSSVVTSDLSESSTHLGSRVALLNGGIFNFLPGQRFRSGRFICNFTSCWLQCWGSLACGSIVERRPQSEPVFHK